MSRKALHLFRRGNVFWFRRRVPRDLVATVGREVKKSLRTSDLKIARQRAAIMLLEVEASFDSTRRDMAGSGNSSPDFELTPAETWALAKDWLAQRRARDETLALMDTETILDGLAIASDTEDYTEAGRETRRLLAGRGLNFGPGSTSYQRRLLSVKEAMIQRKKLLLARFTARPVTLNPRFTNSATWPVLPNADASMPLGELLERFRRDLPPPRSPKTKVKWAVQDRLFTEVLGATTLIAALTRADARKLLEILRIMPGRWVKKHIRPATVLNTDPARLERMGPPMSTSTSNSYLAALEAAFGFAVREGYLERNPALGLRLAGADQVRPADRRLPFAPADLTVIFGSSLYRDTTRPRDAKFWVPLIALFAGMRLGEILQLTADDLVIRDNVDVLLIRSGDGKRKTLSGQRIVPVHRELRRIGLLDRVTAIRKAHGAGAPLFPEIRVSTTGYLSESFSRWWGRFSDGLGLVDKRLSFHSFRHTFKQALAAKVAGQQT